MRTGATADTLRTVGARSDRSGLPRRQARPWAVIQPRSTRPRPRTTTTDARWPSAAAGRGRGRGASPQPRRSSTAWARRSSSPAAVRVDGHAEAVADDEHDAEPRATERGRAEQHDECGRARHQPAGDAHPGERSPAHRPVRQVVRVRRAAAVRVLVRVVVVVVVVLVRVVVVRVRVVVRRAAGAGAGVRRAAAGSRRARRAADPDSTSVTGTTVSGAASVPSVSSAPSSSTDAVCVNVTTAPSCSAWRRVPRWPTRYAAMTVLPCPGASACTTPKAIDAQHRDDREADAEVLAAEEVGEERGHAADAAWQGLRDGIDRATRRAAAHGPGGDAGACATARRAATSAGRPGTPSAAWTGDVGGTSESRSDPHRLASVTSFQPTRSPTAPSTKRDRRRRSMRRRRAGTRAGSS